MVYLYICYFLVFFLSRGILLLVKFFALGKNSRTTSLLTLKTKLKNFLIYEKLCNFYKNLLHWKLRTIRESDTNSKKARPYSSENESCVFL